MIRPILSGIFALASVAAVAFIPMGCQSGGVGDPCIPEDEYNTDFAGFKVTEENIESRSFQCQTRICLVNHFQGRVSCPMGQAKPAQPKEDGADCQVADPKDPKDNENKACCIPGTSKEVSVAVCGQCAATKKRDAEGAVYCSCRCGVAEGEPNDENFNFCECPEGFECKEIRKNVGLGDPNITGKYCIKTNSEFKLESDCGGVKGYYDPAQCSGTRASSQ